MDALKLIGRRVNEVTRRLQPGKRAYVFATESAGSIGDQAMGDVVCRHLTEDFGYDVHVICLPNWTPSKFRGNHQAVILQRDDKKSLQALAIYAKASLYVVVGADVIDGNYGISLPRKWLADLGMAEKLGIPNAAINFSFSEIANPEIVAMMRAAQGTRFVARDPVSLARFEAATGQRAGLSADLAFLLKPEITSPHGREGLAWGAHQKEQGRQVLAVNASGHTLTKMDGDGVGAYAVICRNWLEADPARSIMLVPHDFRPAPVGDVEALTRVAESLADFGDRVFLLRPPFEAWEVKALAEHVDLALTGRMHFAIAAFGMGAPALSLAYLGKFEGLMQHLGLEADDLVLPPSAVLDVPQMTARLEAVTRDAAALRGRILARLPQVQALSRQNFAWLQP